jgi:hypothetical protein
MPSGNTFIDTAGVAIRGKDARLNAWRGFLFAYPTYRNVFVSIFSQLRGCERLGIFSMSRPS